jgi:hypothetical protein
VLAKILDVTARKEANTARKYTGAENAGQVAYGEQPLIPEAKSATNAFGRSVLMTPKNAK